MQKPTVTIKFKAGTICTIEGCIISQLKESLTLECDGILSSGQIIITTARIGDNPIEDDDDI